MQDPGAAKTKSSPRLKTILLVSALCVAAAVVVFTVFADRTPVLDPGILENRKARWHREGPDNYDLSISIQIDREEASLAVVSVRDGKLVSQTYNGLSRESADDSYTVEGLFRTMERELDLANQAEQAGSTVLKAVFEESLGMPTVFKRITTRPGGRSCIILVRELSSPETGILFPAGQP